MRCDMRQLFYCYSKIAPRYISSGSSPETSSVRAAECTEQLLQRISARLSAVEQGRTAEEGERGAGVEMAQLNTNRVEDEYRSEVFYGLLHSLQKLKLLRSSSDIFFNTDVDRDTAFIDIFGDVLPRQRCDGGDGDQTLDDSERCSRRQRSASVSRLSGAAVTSRLADESIRGRLETYVHLLYLRDFTWIHMPIAVSNPLHFCICAPIDSCEVG